MALTDNAIAFWDLDNDADDDSGNGHNGTNNGVSFNGTKGTFGSTNYIDLGTFSALDGLTTLTAMAWLTMPSSLGYANYDGIIGLGANGTRQMWLYGVQSHSSVSTFMNGSYGGETGDVFSTSTLYLVGFTHNGSTQKWYVNGSNVGTDGSFASAFTTHDTTNYIGRIDTFGYWQGAMQSVGLFSDAKDATWWTSIYNSGTPMKWADMAGGGIVIPVFMNQYRLRRA